MDPRTNRIGCCEPNFMLLDVLGQKLIYFGGVEVVGTHWVFRWEQQVL